MRMFDDRPLLDADTFTDRASTVPWWVAAALRQMAVPMVPMIWEAA